MSWWRKKTTPEPMVGVWHYRVADGKAVRLTKDQGLLPYTVTRFEVNVAEPGYAMYFQTRGAADEWMRRLGWDGSPPVRTLIEI